MIGTGNQIVTRGMKTDRVNLMGFLDRPNRLFQVSIVIKDFYGTIIAARCHQPLTRMEFDVIDSSHMIVKSFDDRSFPRTIEREWVSESINKRMFIDWSYLRCRIETHLALSICSLFCFRFFIFPTSRSLMEVSTEPVATNSPHGLNLATEHSCLCRVTYFVE